jgi:hypothetical protein
MSKEDLVEAYLAGQITRRIFVRRLVAAGIGIAAATSYARMMNPARAHGATDDDDFYGDADCEQEQNAEQDQSQSSSSNTNEGDNSGNQQSNQSIQQQQNCDTGGGGGGGGGGGQTQQNHQGNQNGNNTLSVFDVLNNVIDGP